MGKPGALERRAYPPGVHGHSRRKFSEYGLRLGEKQKLLFNYCLREAQLRRLRRRAKSGTHDDWMSNLISLLETCLDNLVFRLGFANSILAAHQLVNHRKVYVNGKRVAFGSALIPVGAEITLSADAVKNVQVQASLQHLRLDLHSWLDRRLVTEHFSKV